MHNERSIPKESRAVLIRRNKQIRKLGLERFIGRHKDRTMLPANITQLACGRIIGVAWWFGASVVGVEMVSGFVAVSFVGDFFFVDVVFYLSVSGIDTYGSGRIP